MMMKNWINSHLLIPICIAVRMNAGYVNLCIFFRFFLNLLIQNLWDVMSGNSIKAIARNHDQIIVFIFRSVQFENISSIGKSIYKKYHIPWAKANIQQRIQIHCLIETIFLRYGQISVKANISANGLEKTIINNNIRAIFQKRLYNQKFRKIRIDSGDA